MPYPHTCITLTLEEKKQIKDELQRLTYQKQWKKRYQFQALYLSDQKKPFQDIANYLGVSYMSVRRWVYKYRKTGLNDFLKHKSDE